MANRVHTGQRLGNYYLIQRLGAGGFAEVYLGEHIHLKNRAALKVLQTALSQTEAGNIRKEAQVLAQLDHPHIVRLRDFAIDKNTPFLVMDYASGGTLRERHPEGTQLSCAQAVDYVWQIAEALQYAHQQHIIHRDIKPENLLLNKRGEVLVSDFGIAHLTQSLHLTHASVAGTTSYMAPEQIQGKPRRASDQYALAVVVYEWLTGTRPFVGDPQSVLSQHLLADPPPLRSIVPDLSPAIEAVVLAALAKAPEDRYPSIQAFAHALELASQVASGESNDTSLLPENLPALYQEGWAAKAREDLEEAERLWAQVVERAPFFRNGVVAEQLDEIRQQLLPIHINQWKEAAAQAHKAGDWEQEIEAWQQVLQLNPRLREAQTCLQQAQQHQRYVHLYQDAVQLVEDHQDQAARELLQQIWADDPYYGDPADLASILKVRVPPSYQEEQQREKQETQRRKLLREAYGPDFAGSRVVPFAAWCCILGAGLTNVGVTQSWIAALFALVTATLAGWSMGYRRMLSKRLLALIFLVSTVLTSIIALLLTFVNFQQPYTGTFLQTTYPDSQAATPTIVHATWHIWPQSQVVFGVLSGLLLPVGIAIFICWHLPPITLRSFEDRKTRGKTTNQYVSPGRLLTVAGIAVGIWVLSVAAALSYTQSDMGFGSDAGIPLLLLGLAGGLLLGLGVAISLPLWCTVLRWWIEARSK